MALNVGLKSNLLYVIFLSIVIHSLVNYKPRSQLGQDAESAITRASSSICKTELEEFASERLKQAPRHIERTCPFDRRVTRHQRIGCISDSSSHIVPLESIPHLEINATICRDTCFSYGHSHAGYQDYQRNCYCGDESSVIDIQDSRNCSDTSFDWYKVNNGIYEPPQRRLTGTDTTNESVVKIAFLLTLSGRSSLQVLRLINNIYSENHFYYLHIDKRDNYLYHQLKFLEQEFDNIVLAKQRFATLWGSPDLLKMIVESMRRLIHRDWDYLINLSESDFPLKPLSDIENYLTNSNRSIFLKSHNLGGYEFIKKQGLDRDFYQCEDRVWNMGKRQLPRGIIFSGGSDWFALPKDLCSYIVANLNDSSTLVEPLMELYEKTLLPVESFFHTLVINSKFCDRLLDDNLRLTNWNHKRPCWCQHREVVDWCGCSPLNYRKHDWRRLAQTAGLKNLLLSRKFDHTISMSIIKEVEESLIGKQSTKLTNVTRKLESRFWQSIYDSTEVQRAHNEDVMLLELFGLYSLRKITTCNSSQIGFTSTRCPVEMRSVTAYFEHDRFRGLIFDFRNATQCIKFLIEVKTDNLVYHYNQTCFTDGAQDLRVIEVNHGFDVNERMFRDHKPVNSHSDVIVYHEWKLRNMTQVRINQAYAGNNRIQFIWVSPQNRIELIQDVKLRQVTKTTRMTLAHRLNIQKPHKPGEWNLIVAINDSHCLKYKFLVLDKMALANGAISDATFDQFYRVVDWCVTNTDTIKTAMKSCQGQEWILSNDSLMEQNSFNL